MTKCTRMGTINDAAAGSFRALAALVPTMAMSASASREGSRSCEPRTVAAVRCAEPSSPSRRSSVNSSV